MKLLAPFVLMIVTLATVVYLDDTPPDAEFVFVNSNDAFTLDPQRMSYIQDLRLAHALYEGLLRWDNHDFSILPATADLPEISADGRTYVFHLKPEARWSNGAPVTAHDFVYSWQRAILPDSAADYSNLFFLIEGARSFFNWRQSQLARFNANIFAADNPNNLAEPSQVLRVVERIETLLRAENLPAEIRIPTGSQKNALQAELNRLRTGIEQNASSLQNIWSDLTVLPSVYHRLNTESSRAAESQWLWDRTQLQLHSDVGLRTLDDHTLQITLAKPNAYFLDLICFGVFSPVYRPAVEGWHLSAEDQEQINQSGWHVISEPPLDQRRWFHVNPQTGRCEQKHNWTKPDRHVGNGPYVLRQWRYKRDMRLEKNSLYHNAEKVRNESIVALVIEDTNTAVLAFESGRLDWLSGVDAEYRADMLTQRRTYLDQHADELMQLHKRGIPFDEALATLPEPQRGERRNIHTFPTFGTDFFSFNCRPVLADGRTNPFAQAAVRRAFARCVNKEIIVQQVTRLSEPIVNTLIPPGSIPGYESPAGLTYDPDAARQELVDAGWEDRNGDGLIEDRFNQPFPVVDLLWSTNTPRYKWISLELKAQWERELGVRIELRGEDTKFLKDDLIHGKFMIARGNWYGDYGDPTTFLNLCRTDDGNNDRKFSSRVIDTMLDQADEERDPDKRMAMLQECERILFEEEVPLIPICQLVQLYMYEPGVVRGLSEHPRLTQYLWQIEVNRP